MSTIATYPESVGTLTPAESVVFSKPFENDWNWVRETGLGTGADGILLPQSTLDHESFGLPLSYAQFVPAIKLAVMHERANRGQLELDRSVLTVRQWFVEAQRSQQSYDTDMAHQDSDGLVPERFYSVGDVVSTQYFPDITDQKGRSIVRLAPNQPYVTFNPCEVIHASAATFHRSPPMPRDGIRTFMRLTFQYLPEA